MAESNRIYGLHAVRAMLRRTPQRVRQIWFQQGRDDQRLSTLRASGQQAGINCQVLPKRELDALVPDVQHQGVVAEVEAARSAGERELVKALEKMQEPPFLLVLDRVQDPHNLGACLRSADAAGVHGVIIPKDHSVGLTPVVRKVACGAVEAVQVYAVANLARALERLKEAGVWIYGAAQEASDPLYNSDLTGPIALVLGGEGKGLRRLTRERCDGLLAIPMAGSVESLNVSVAAGIMLFEVKRQRLALD